MAPAKEGTTDGYAFFGLHDVAAFFRGAADDPDLSEWNDDTEGAANGRYEQMVPDDAHLAARFEKVYGERVEEFAPVDAL